MRYSLLFPHIYTNLAQIGITYLVCGIKALTSGGGGRYLCAQRAILDLKRSGIVQGLLPVFSTLPYLFYSDKANIRQSTRYTAVNGTICRPIG